VFDNNPITALMNGTDEGYLLSRHQLLDQLQTAYSLGFDEAERELAGSRIPTPGTRSSETYLAPNT
jgi:hypothetical protein